MVILRNPQKMILAIYVSSKCEKTNHKKINYNLMGRFFQTFFLFLGLGQRHTRLVRFYPKKTAILNIDIMLKKHLSFSRDCIEI